VKRPPLPALAALVACAFVPSTPAQAQDKAATAARPAPASARQAGSKKVIRLDALTVEGRIQKPEAFYVLPRSSLSFDELQKTESFVPKIEKSVEKEPF
jgi:hypothetical protein